MEWRGRCGWGELGKEEASSKSKHHQELPRLLKSSELRSESHQAPFGLTPLPLGDPWEGVCQYRSAFDAVLCL
jgi:hypothetical protein